MTAASLLYSRLRGKSIRGTFSFFRLSPIVNKPPFVVNGIYRISVFLRFASAVPRIAPNTRGPWKRKPYLCARVSSKTRPRSAETRLSYLLLCTIVIDRTRFGRIPGSSLF